MPRLRESFPGPRKYVQEGKDRFFRELDLCGSVSVAARELGLNKNTCFKRAKKAGIRSRGVGGTAPHPGREEFSRLCKAGISRHEAARGVGVNIRTARDWDQSGNPALQQPTRLPAGTVVDYKRGVTTTTTPAGTAGTVPGAPVLLPALEKPTDPALPVPAGAGNHPGYVGRRRLAEGCRVLTGQFDVDHQPRALPQQQPEPRLSALCGATGCCRPAAPAERREAAYHAPAAGIRRGPGRAAPGDRSRAGAPAGPGVRPTNPGRSALPVRGPDGHDLRAPAGGRGAGRAGP